MLPTAKISHAAHIKYLYISY